MTRSLMAVAAAAALVGMGGKVEAFDEADAKLREEREAQHRYHVKRAEARRQARIDEEKRKSAEIDMLRAGIDPTNGRPLSRQQRRFLSRRNFPFLVDAASVDTHPKDGDVQQAPLVSGAVPGGETPK